MSTITIPDTIDEAVTSLDGIGRLVQAREWKRAAIVWALTHYEGGSRGPRSMGQMSQTLTYSQLAEKGIVGLTNRKRVAWYHDQWQSVIDDGYADPVGLGDSIDIPDDWEWPPNDSVGERDTSMTEERREHLMEAGREAGLPTGSKVVDIVANQRSLQAAIKADPATAEAAAAALVSNDEGIRALRRAEQEAATARLNADPTYPERHARAVRDAATDGAVTEEAMTAITRRRNLGLIELWLKEWGRAGDIEAIDLVALMVDEVRGVIATQAQGLTPEMFSEGGTR